VGRDSSVGTANRYGLDSPGIESRWEIFHTRPERPWGPPNLLYDGYRVSFPGVKRPGRGVDHPPPSSAEVKERVELYLYSPLSLHGLLQGELYFNFTTLITSLSSHLWKLSPRLEVRTLAGYSTLTGLWDGRFSFRIPTGARYVSTEQPYRLWNPPNLLLIGYRGPIIGYRCPIIGYRCPIIGYQGPIIGYRGPIIGYQGPIIGYKEGGA
jgi:hypothetical protein